MEEHIEHEALGHVEQVKVGTNKYSVYECSYCGYQSETQLDDHWRTLVGIDNDHAMNARTLIYDYEEPLYENRWIVDQEAYIETKLTCSICRATK